MATEGLRYNTGKAPLEMVPLHLLEGTARVFYDVTTREVNPYPKWNWALDKEWSVPYACALRHLAKWFAGEDVDSETGHSHISHAICNLLMLEHYRTSCPQMDDRPKKEFTKNEELVSQAAGAGGSGLPGEVVEVGSQRYYELGLDRRPAPGWQDHVFARGDWPGQKCS